MKRRRKDIGDRDRENKKRECVRNQENYKNYGNRDEGEGFSDVWPQVSQFLDRVEEQIEYRPVRESIRREMGDHIEDRMQDYISGGCGREEAAKKAVAGMGDPEVIGRQLNDIRRPRKDYALPAVVLLCVAAGLLVSFLSGFRDLNFFSQNVYFLFGIAVLFFFVRKGCFFAARYAKAVSVLYFSAFLLLILLTRLLHWRYTPAIYNGNFLLPVAALLLIGAAESKKKSGGSGNRIYGSSHRLPDFIRLSVFYFFRSADSAHEHGGGRNSSVEHGQKSDTFRCRETACRSSCGASDSDHCGGCRFQQRICSAGGGFPDLFFAGREHGKCNG